MPEGFSKFPLDENEKPFAAGSERRIYHHPKKKNKIVAVENVAYQRNAQHARQEYYLTKIMHILLPDNIPDIHFYGSKPSMSVRQNVELGPAHQRAQKEMLAYRMDDGNLGHLTSEYYRSSRLIEKTPEVRRLINTLWDFGLNVDTFMGNFGIDEKGNAKYVEPFSALFDYHIRYDAKKIKDAIEKLENQTQRRRALKCLERLEALSKKDDKK